MTPTDSPALRDSDLSDEQCDAIVRSLDGWVRNKHGSYEFGLPTWDDECFIVQRHVIRTALRATQQPNDGSPTAQHGSDEG